MVATVSLLGIPYTCTLVYKLSSNPTKKGEKENNLCRWGQILPGVSWFQRLLVSYLLRPTRLLPAADRLRASCYRLPAFCYRLRAFCYRLRAFCCRLWAACRTGLASTLEPFSASCVHGKLLVFLSRPFPLRDRLNRFLKQTKNLHFTAATIETYIQPWKQSYSQIFNCDNNGNVFTHGKNSLGIN